MKPRHSLKPQVPLPDKPMSPARSGELAVRFLGEHFDAYLLVGIRPDGQPVIRSNAANPRDALAVNAIFQNIGMHGGIPIGTIQSCPDDQQGG